MIDTSKRRTLKLISGAAALGGATLSRVAFADEQLIPASAKQPAGNISCSQLQIQIITGNSTPEDTVIFNNSTSEPVAIDHFLPGFVTLGNQMIDMNTLTKDKKIVIQPGYPLASNLSRWEILSLGPGDSYLWCDTAAEAFQTYDNTSNTATADQAGVINIAAVVVNGRAMLTLDHTAANPALS